MSVYELEVILLLENTVYRNELMAEHGLSYWIRYRGQEYLFDTGQGMVLLHNAARLRIDLTRLSGIILSHGHYDHTGGLKKLLNIDPELKVYAHPDIFRPKFFADHENGLKLRREDIPGFVPVEGQREISPGLWAVNEVPRSNQFEVVNSNFLAGDGENLEADEFLDDQSLFIETGKGLVVLTGCCHLGIVNHLEYIRKLSGDREIHRIIGGTHLINSTEERIDQTIDYLSDLKFQSLTPLHCTGPQAVHQITERLGERVEPAYTGDRFRIK